MARELPRTLHSLSASHQRDVDAADYEVIVVDNGSPDAIVGTLTERFEGRLRIERLDPAPPSPVRAANRGLEIAEGELIGLVVDGARLASPGLISTARLATTLAERPVITAPAWHIGATAHMRAAEAGYDLAAEDALLAECGWEDDGYRLFTVSTLAGSSGRGVFAPMGESSSLFLRRDLWDELGGLDERFDLPGGGLVNHDLYRRACDLEGVQLVVALGEGTFHQFHGGASTSRRHSWDEMHDQYRAIRGERYRPPTNRALYLGTVPEVFLEHVERSVTLAREWEQRRRGR